VGGLYIVDVGVAHLLQRRSGGGTLVWYFNSWRPFDSMLPWYFKRDGDFALDGGDCTL